MLSTQIICGLNVPVGKSLLAEWMTPIGPVSYTHLDVYKRQRAGSGGVQDLEVLLQDGFRHEGNQEGGSGVCTAAEVLHVQVERGTGTHSLPEFCECGNGGERNDKGRAEQTRGEIRNLFPI